MVFPTLYRIMGLTQALKVGGGIALVLLVLALFAIIGAVSGAASVVVIVAAVYLLGLISQGTAYAVLLWFAAFGAVVGVIKGLVLGVAAS